ISTRVTTGTVWEGFSSRSGNMDELDRRWDGWAKRRLGAAFAGLTALVAPPYSGAVVNISCNRRASSRIGRGAFANTRVRRGGVSMSNAVAVTDESFEAEVLK